MSDPEGFNAPGMAAISHEPVACPLPREGDTDGATRVTREILYDSETTLRLVGRALDDLDALEPLEIREMPLVPVSFRAEQLGGGATADTDNGFLRLFWELQGALEVLREGHAVLEPSLAGSFSARDREMDHLNHALALVDGLGDREGDGAGTHERLRDELLALSASLQQRDELADRLHLTADLLRDLEGRLSGLAAAFQGGDRE